MSKVDDFNKNSLDMILGSEEKSDAANRKNREIVKNATDEELQAIADATRIHTLEGLKQARDLFRAALNETIE